MTRGGLAKEKSDMDNFYDSLDHNAAVKEAKARQKRASTAAFRATVENAKAELKEIESKPAVTHPKVSEKAAAVTKAAVVDDKADVLKPLVAPKVVAKSQAAPKPVVVLVAASSTAAPKATPKVAAVRKAAVYDAKAEVKKMPKLSAEASRQKIMGYFDALVNKAKSRVDLEHPNPSENNPSLSAGAARSTMASYFNSL